MSNVRTLKEFSTLKTGPFGTQFKASEYVPEGIPVINVKNIGYGNIVRDNLDHISERTRDRLSEHVLQRGDIVFGRKGSVDRHCLITEAEEGWFQGSDCLRVRITDPAVDPQYVSYYLLSSHVLKAINNAAVGSTMASLNMDIIGDIKITLPSYERQCKIAAVLKALDDKRAINTAVNDNLEHQLQDIYNYWFTQFDFPDVNGQPYKSSGGVMVWNEQLKRKIPANWQLKQLGEVCAFRNGINYDKDVAGDKTYRIINVRNISSSTTLLSEDELDEIILPQKHADKYCVAAESIIIARSGIPGATRILYRPSANTIFCGFIICGTPIESNMQYYLMLLLKQLEGSSATQTGGSILKNVSQDTLGDLLVPIPPKDVLAAFNHQAIQALDLIHNNLNESANLRKLRDWLLPMLMNGQATVSD